MDIAERISDVFIILTFVKENTKNTSMNSITRKTPTNTVYAILRLLREFEVLTFTEKRIAQVNFRTVFMQWIQVLLNRKRSVLYNLTLCSQKQLISQENKMDIIRLINPRMTEMICRAADVE